MSLTAHIERHVETYGALPLFEAFANDHIPVERFPVFFPQMAMVARIFQDLIWAVTDIDSGPYAAFAARHRKRDGGHYRWMAFDLDKNGLPPANLNSHYQLEWLPARLQMARILALTHKASPEDRMVILAALEAAGAVTLGTLHRYAARNGLLDRTRYLGTPHMRIEETQVGEIEAVAHELLDGESAEHRALIDTVFDALSALFRDGAQRYYADLVGEEAA
ncbi:MAG: hypothetical protein AB8H79_16205 [Myxococcota bacterium]